MSFTSSGADTGLMGLWDYCLQSSITEICPTSVMQVSSCSWIFSTNAMWVPQNQKQDLFLGGKLNWFSFPCFISQIVQIFVVKHCPCKFYLFTSLRWDSELKVYKFSRNSLDSYILDLVSSLTILEHVYLRLSRIEKRLWILGFSACSFLQVILSCSC